MAEDNQSTDDVKVDEESAPPAKQKRQHNMDVTQVRSKAAQVVWIACVAFALFLAVGALCVALDANEDNGLVSFILGMADRVDLGVFSREGGVKEFGGENADVKNALFNWGLGAIAWLVVGRLAERLIRP